jgi:hypothetical protein
VVLVVNLYRGVVLGSNSDARHDSFLSCWVPRSHRAAAEVSTTFEVMLVDAA